MRMHSTFQRTESLWLAAHFRYTEIKQSGGQQRQMPPNVALFHCCELRRNCCSTQGVTVVITDSCVLQGVLWAPSSLHNIKWGQLLIPAWKFMACTGKHSFSSSLILVASSCRHRHNRDEGRTLYLPSNLRFKMWKNHKMTCQESTMTSQGLLWSWLFWRLRQLDHKFKVCLGYRVGSRLLWFLKETLLTVEYLQGWRDGPTVREGLLSWTAQVWFQHPQGSHCHLQLKFKGDPTPSQAPACIHIQYI